MATNSPLKGTCLNMCPIKEVKWREKNKLLHVLEIQTGTESDPKADLAKVIKQFSRSAAGKVQPTPADLRPSNILLKTMNYLIDDIILLNTIPWIEIYNFVDDRVQAIRQDITMQMIEDVNAVEIYEKCVRFYIISSYVLCEEEQSKFDQYLNNKQMRICLEKLISLYQRFKSENLYEFVSIHFCLNMENYESFCASGILFKNFLNNNLVKLTVKICSSYIDCNFIKFYICIQKLPLILQLCFFHHFKIIRRQALKVMNVAFSSASCEFPLQVLCNWLCISENDVLQMCNSHNIKVHDKKIYFSKKAFDADVKVPDLSKEYLIDNNLNNVNLSLLINGRKQ